MTKATIIEKPSLGCCCYCCCSVGVAAVAVASKSNVRVGVNHANEYVGADAQALQDF